MSELHLTKGSQPVPKVEGLLRLYSMKFCPFAQRARMVLLAKNIPHDIVNIDLFEKPEWYFNIHEKGLVPALDTGSEIIVESLVICDYLDEKYPENPLYPADPQAKQQDKDLIQKIGPIVGAWANCLWGNESKSAQEWKDEFLPLLQGFEDELKKRNSTFFGGSKPGMVDYMLWPWAERAAVIGLRLNQKLPFSENDIPLLRQWKKDMRAQPVIDKVYVGPERFWKVGVCKLEGSHPDYNNA